MVYIFLGSRHDSASANLLAAWLRANGTDTRVVRYLPDLGGTDLLVNWGSGLGLPKDPRVLNGGLCLDKYRQLEILRDGGVPVPPFLRHKPTSVDGETWLARRRHHHAANDLLGRHTLGEYYVKLLDITQEFRVHVFDGRCIRVGMKVPAANNAHPVFRTHTAGWVYTYGRRCQEAMRTGYRALAKKAVAVLEQDFGAVDLGVRKDDGSPIVFEVNSAPGLVDNTAAAYGRNIQRRLREMAEGSAECTIR